MAGGIYPFADQGRRLRLLRRALGMYSGFAFAAFVGWTRSSVSQFETGVRRVPKNKVIQLMTKIPGFNPVWLWDGDESGLSFDLRTRIEAEERKSETHGAG